MKIALFVEGSAPHGPKDHCAQLWNGTLLPALTRAPVAHVIPIGKDAITRLLGLRASSSAAGLDARIVDEIRRSGLDPERDAIVIAWDLEPVDEGQSRCAWRERWRDRERDPSATLEAAVDAMRELRPRAEVRRQLRNIYTEAKDEWCDYLLRKLLVDSEQAAAIREHAIARRLAHVLPPV